MAHGFEQHAQHLPRIVLILDHEHPADDLSALRFVLATDHRVRLTLQSHDELASFAESVAERADRSAVEFDNLPYQRQPDSQTSRRALESLIVLDEQFKDVRKH